MKIFPIKVHRRGLRKTKRRLMAPEFLPPLTPCNIPPMRCLVSREQASHRILIMRLGSFGDILMGTPLLTALRRAYPNAHITWIAEHTGMQAIDANPYVDEILRWDSSYWKRMVRNLQYPLWLTRILQMRNTLHRNRYDIFISFQPEEWPLLARGAGASTTIGVFDTFRQFSGTKKTSFYAKRYTHAYTYADLPEHRTDQYLLPLEALDLPRAEDKQMVLGFTAEDAAAAEDFLIRQPGYSADLPFVVLAPMTTWSSRNWPAERYVQLGDALAKLGCRVALISSPSLKEREAVSKIAAQMHPPPMPALGLLSFRQMAALTARASLLISGDTGPMHVAAAVGTPYLALFGPTPILGRAPLAGRGLSLAHAVPCGPCDKEFCILSDENYLLCLKLITVDEALSAAEKLLSPSGL